MFIFYGKKAATMFQGIRAIFVHDECDSETHNRSALEDALLDLFPGKPYVAAFPEGLAHLLVRVTSASIQGTKKEAWFLETGNRGMLLSTDVPVEERWKRLQGLLAGKKLP